MKLKTYLTAGLLTLGAPLAAQAGVNLSFDTQTAGVVEINGFAWAQSSFLASGGTAAFAARLAVGNGNDCGTACDFTVYNHGTLTSATLDGAPRWSPVIGAEEITYTLAFTETVTSVNATATQADFAVVTTGTVVFEMYYDTLTGFNDATRADPLTGSGFSDGTLILYGDAILDSTGSFEQTDIVNLVPIDGSGTDDYPGQLTTTGEGNNVTIELGGLQQDSNFFLDQLAAFGFDFNNLSLNIPFTSANPSDCFYAGTNAAGGANVGTDIADVGCARNHVDGLFELNEGDATATTLVPRTGSVNGSPQQGTYKGVGCFGELGLVCTDFVAQTDTNSSVQIEEVPAPGTLAITGLGLLLLGFGRRRNLV